MPEPLRAKALRQLDRLGIEVQLNTRVTGIDDAGVHVGEDRLPAATVLWAAGVQASGLAAQLGGEVDGAGRVHVGPDCAIPGQPDVFAVGDLTVVEQDGQILPGTAPVAITQGRHAARCITADLNGRSRPEYHYFDKGHLATIGRSKAVGVVGPVKLSGWLAWALWAFVHLLFLVTYRNRLVVFTKWAWAWFTFERASRLLYRSAPSLTDRSAGT